MRAANFDRIARPYRWLELFTFGRSLHRTRTAFLPQITQEKDLHRALILGDGDGRFTHDLLLAHPTLQVQAVDGSTAMLALLEERCIRFRDRLLTTHTDARRFRPVGVADLVVTHFFLDCFTTDEVDRIVQNVSQNLREGGLWIVSEFHISPDGAMRWISRQIVRGLYLGFRVLTGLRTTGLPDYASAMRRSGLRRIQTQHFLGGLLIAEIWCKKQT